MQFVVPAAQPAQTPLVHTWPAAHMRPQVPQLALSVPRLTQTPLQLVNPVAHTQAPFTQVWLAAHTRPHSPQLLRSVPRLAQPLGHSAWPAGQEVLPQRP